MSRNPGHEVSTRLTDWAVAQPPAPSPSLQQFMGPVRPIRAAADRGALSTVARAGLGLKIFIASAAVAVTGAAAVGITAAVSHQPSGPRHETVPVSDPGSGASTPSAAHDATTGPATHATTGAGPAEEPTTKPPGTADPLRAPRPAGSATPSLEAPQTGEPSDWPSTDPGEPPATDPASDPTSPPASEDAGSGSADGG
jgi:hypothetical protein